MAICLTWLTLFSGGNYNQPVMNNDNPISRFEQIMQRVVEGTLSRLFGEQILPQVIAVKLARSLETSSYNTNRQIANHFEVFLHPADLTTTLEESPEIVVHLQRYILQLATEANFPLTDLPRIEIKADELLQQQQVRVAATYDPTRDSNATRQHRRQQLDDAVRNALKSVDAFLILNGDKHVALDQPMISIGRRMDNDIVLDSPSVSRRHAQIRWRYNHFIIYDSGSRAGVKVNGQKIRECVLQPGDVVVLADVTMVYGEGDTRSKAPISQRDPDSKATRAMRQPADLSENHGNTEEAAS